jgi:glycogen synthase
MKRVLMTADTLGGVWNYSIELIRALPEIEFALCTFGAPLSRVQAADVAVLKNVTASPSSYKLEWMDEPWRDVDHASDWLLEIARKFQPDLIHLNGYSHASLPWSAPVVVVAHSCVLSWWRAVKHEDAPARFDEYRNRVTAGVNGADLVIAPSRSMLESLRENHDAQFPGRFIYNGADPARFSPFDKQPIIFAAGRIWDEAKNLRALDSIAAQLPWPVEIAGDLADPDGRTTMPQHARALGKLNASEIALAMARAAIFAAPARYEPFGLSILEAALSGCALVLGDIPSLREIWSDCALFVNPNDEVELARALNRLIADKNLRASFSGRAHERAQDFSIQRTAASYREVYARLTRARPAEVAA